VVKVDWDRFRGRKNHGLRKRNTRKSLRQKWEGSKREKEGENLVENQLPWGPGEKNGYRATKRENQVTQGVKKKQKNSSGHDTIHTGKSGRFFLKKQRKKGKGGGSLRKHKEERGEETNVSKEGGCSISKTHLRQNVPRKSFHYPRHFEKK